LALYLNSGFAQAQISEHTIATTQPKLSLFRIEKIVVNYPISKIDQSSIVQEIESRLSICDKIEEIIEQGLKQAEALRQSVLKKGFEGKLVPQDLNDEPASVLLERIKSPLKKA
jgi:type I restriction enzyme S subunit